MNGSGGATGVLPLSGKEQTLLIPDASQIMLPDRAVRVAEPQKLGIVPTQVHAVKHCIQDVQACYLYAVSLSFDLSGTPLI